MGGGLELRPWALGWAAEKPAGLPCFPPHADPDGDCVLRRLIEALPAQALGAWPAGFEGGIAHRLDTSTSGQLLICRDPAALEALRARFEARGLRKRYRLVSARRPPWTAHEIDRPIAHDRQHKGRMVVQRSEGTPHRGRWYPAHTRFSRRSDGPGWTLWDAEMRTGVTHQIRVHAAFLGIPLAGDRRYGGGPAPPGLRLPEGVDFLLHHVGVQGLAAGGLGDDPPPAPPPPGWPPG